jgi:hypothetical protein
VLNRQAPTSEDSGNTGSGLKMTVVNHVGGKSL